jgi:hypothetical protein
MLRFCKKSWLQWLKFIPSLNHLKVMAADKLNLESSQNVWKPALVYFEEKYNAAFIVEEGELMVSLFLTKTNSFKEGK